MIARPLRRPAVLSVVLALGAAFAAPVAAGAFTVTGVQATVAPKSYAGPCPVTVHFSGTITADGAGTTSYRWSHSPGTGTLETVTFAAAGAKTVTKDLAVAASAQDFLELYVEKPNGAGALVDYTVACGPAVPSGALQKLVPVRRPGPPPLAVKLKDGRAGFIVGERLYLVRGEGTVLAPDGDYELADGTRLHVAGGKITKKTAPASLRVK
jgi:hypothetical protein